MQRDAASALEQVVQSLAGYIDQCCFFVVLAPAVMHENGHVVDYLSWKTRGWCRFERLSRMLSTKEDTEMLLVTCSYSVVHIGGQDYMYDPTGFGEFSQERDKAQLALRAKHLLQLKLQQLMAAGRLTEYRYLLAHRRTLLLGLPAGSRLSLMDAAAGTCESPLEEALSAFMRAFVLTSPTRSISGTSPLGFATMVGDTEVMKLLLGRRARVDGRDTCDKPEYGLVRVMSPEHFATTCGHAGALRLLLAHRADINARDAAGDTPLISLASDDLPTLRTVLENRGDMNSRNKFSDSPLDRAVAHCRLESVKVLIAAGHPLGRCPDGLNALHRAALFRAGAEMAKLLIQARVSLDDRCKPRRGRPLWVVSNAWSLASACGARGFVSLFSYHCFGSTPLIYAAAFGNSAQYQAMLDMGANPSARNARGFTAEQVAEYF